MIPVYQTHFSRNGDKGNCWQACLASLAEVPLREVPDTRNSTNGDWWTITERWLDERGFTITPIAGRRKHGEYHLTSDAPEGWAIASGASPRGTTAGHSIIIFDGKMIHDPHPSGAGLEGFPEHYHVILPK